MSSNRMLITLGTPFGTWTRLAEHLREQAPQAVAPAAPAFSAWYERLSGISALNRPDPEAIAMPRCELNIGPNLAIPALRQAQDRPRFARAEIHLQENKIDSDLQAGIRNGFLQDDGAERGFSRSPAAQVGDDWGGMDMHACWTAEVWAELSSVAEFLIFFEPPERTLAHWLATEEAVDPETLLQIWRVGAERILRLVRRYRRRVLLVDTREAAAYPTRLLEVSGERFGIAFAGDAASAPDWQTDAAFVALAGSWIRPDKRLRAICAELEVSCTPLTADVPTGEDIAGIPQTDPLAALAQYRAVRRQRDTLGRETERLTVALEQAQGVAATAEAALQEERGAGERRMANAEAECDRLRTNGEQAQQENEFLLLQLHQAQEELEATFLKQQETERKRADFEAKLKDSAEAVTKAKAAEAETAAGLKAERENTARLVAEHKIECDRLREYGKQAECKRAELETKLKESADALTKVKIAQAEATKTLHAERKSSTQRMAELEAERDRLRAQAEAASPGPEFRQENELLLLQLHQVQEELEHYFLENQKLKGRAETNQTKPQRQALKVADIQIAGVCEEAPFCHLNFSLRDVTQGPRRFDALDVRLVEHRGEPGLVIFAARDDVAPLSSWTESGKEQDRAFMLLHPQHKTSQTLFARMTASDWLLINDVAALMQTALHNAAEAQPRLAARWGLICQRLREQFAELPPAFRYDRAQVVDIVDAAGKLEVALRLSNAAFRQRVCTRLCVRLCLTGGRGVRADLPGRLVFLAPDEHGALPPLSIWPLTEEGDWAQECTLQFGKGLSGAEKRAQWQALDSHDRELVTSLLYGLPAALAESWEVVPPAGLGHANISLLADKMAREIGSGLARTRDSRTPVLRRVVG